MIEWLKNNKQRLLQLLVAVVVGWASAWAWFGLFPDDASTEGEKKPLYWVAPMDPNYRRDRPGKSPMGMDLIPVYEEGAPSGEIAGTVRISPAVSHNLGVRVAEVTRGPLDLEINTVGYISFDEKRLTHFHSRVEGWIEKLAVTAVGDPVKKGQPLLELYSPKLVTAGEEYLAALASGSSMLIKASASKLEALGVEPAQIEAVRRSRKVPQRLAFFADQDGYVAALNVREGMFIQPATAVLSIGGLDTVWVIAEIFERQAGWVETGYTVGMTVGSYPGERWQGKVDYLYPVVNAQTRTLRARIKFDNPGHRLKPDMFAQLVIHAGRRDSALSVPREAIIRDGKMDRVVKALGEGRYRSARIETGIESGNRVEVLEGLQAGDQVVVSAQFLIDSESSVSADLSRIEAEPEKQAAAVDETWAEGTIETMMPEHGMATIQHAPVPEWQWPAMRMDFLFSDDIDLGQLAQGQRLRFRLQRNGDGKVFVTAVEVLPKDNAANGKPSDARHQHSNAPATPPSAHRGGHDADGHAGHGSSPEHNHD